MMIMTPRKMAKPPQRGAVIHHHDQLITLVNFKIKNTMNNNPPKLTPLLVVLDCDIILFLNCL